MNLSFGEAQGGSEQLERMIRTVIDAVNPEKIFCRHDFLLIVLAGKGPRALHEYRSLIEASVTQGMFPYTLIDVPEMENYLSEGHLFYSTFCTRENLVYDRGQPMLPLPLALRIRQMAERTTLVFNTGFRKARSFLEGAVFYLAREDHALAAFMLHQAAEQCLRAMILSVTGQEVRTHAIAELRQHLKRCAPQLYGFFSAETEKEKRLLDRLEKAYTCARYTDRYEVAEEDLLLLLGQVRMLLKETKKVFDDMTTTFTGHVSTLNGSL